MKPATLARKLPANRRRAFTLVELLVVVASIAIGDAIVHSIYWEGADYSDAAWPWDGLAPDYIEITSVLGMKPSTWSPPTTHTAADVKAMRAVLRRWHGGRWNVLFCDGHVESLTTPNLFDTRKASVPMRWNNDNLPDH